MGEGRWLGTIEHCCHIFQPKSKMQETTLKIVGQNKEAFKKKVASKEQV